MDKKYDREEALVELYERMSKEFDAFKEHLLAKPDILLIDKYAMYELIYKQDILACFEEDNGYYHDNDIRFLLSKDKPLRWIYLKWLDRSDSHLRMIRSFIRDSIMYARFSRTFYDKPETGTG